MKVPKVTIPGQRKTEEKETLRTTTQPPKVTAPAHLRTPKADEKIKGTAKHEPSPVSDSPLLAPLKRAQGSTYLAGGTPATATPYAAGPQAGIVKTPERTEKPKKEKPAQEAQTPAWMGLMDQTAAELEQRHTEAIDARNALRERVKQGETPTPNSTYAASSGGYKPKEANPIPSTAAASGAWVSEEDKRLLPIRLEQERKQTEINDLATAHYYRKNQEQFAKLETDAAARTSYDSAKELTADLDALSKALSAPTSYNGQDTRFNAAGEALAQKYGTYDLQTLQRTLTAQKARLVEELAAKGYDFETMAGYDRMLDQQETYVKTQEKWQKDAEEHPVSMSGLSVFLSPLQGADAVRTWGNSAGHSNADDLGSYVPNNVYDMYATNAVQTIRGTVSRKIEENTNWELFGQNVASFLYNTGMSVADSALQVATLGSGATFVMGLSSAANTTKEIIERGGSNEQAFWGGLAAGVAECVFEEFSVEHILKLDFGEGWKGAVKAVLSQAGVEASEEMLTEVANILSDTMVMGERSGLVAAAKEYESQGVNKKTAWLRATLDSLGQVAWAGAGGALSGLGMAGGKLALQQGSNAIYDAFTQRRQGDSVFSPLNTEGARTDAKTGVDTPSTRNPVEGVKNAPTEGAGLNPVSAKMEESLSTGKNNFIAKTASDIVTFAKRALQKKGGAERLYMGTLPDATVEFVKQQTGIDVSGYQAVLPGDSVQHTQKHHGDPIKEQARGQRVVTAEDYGMIPQVLAAPDSVRLADRTDSSGRKVILFSKQMGDVYVTAQAVTDSRHALTTDTVWIRKGKPTDTTHNASVTADPVHNAQGVPPSGFPTDSIPQTAQDVNPESGDGMPNSVGAAAAGFTGDKERGFSRNLATDTARHEEVQHEYQVNPQMYHTLANAETLQKATNIFNQGVNQAKAALDQAIGAAQAGRKLNPEMVPLAKMTADALAQQGDMAEAERILSSIGAELTQAGQLGQAAKILRDASPATKAQAIQNIVDEINKKVKKADIQVDEGLLAEYAAETDENAANAVLDQIYQNIADQIPPTLVERWNALRYLNMLGNLKTQVRNIAGNVAGGVTRAVKDRVAAGIEAVVYKASGGKFERTKSVGYDPALFQAARQDFEAVKSQALGEAKYSDHAVAMQDIQDKRRIFQSNFKNDRVKNAVDTLLTPLEGYRKVTNWAMEEGDAIFSKANYADALAQWLTAHKITAEMWAGGEVDADTMDKARAYAIREAQRATYRDNNVFSDTISKIGFRNPENKTQRAVNVMLQGVLPFRRTPANVAVRMVEYSPLGIVETAVKTVQMKNGTGNVTGADVVDSLASNLTGTGLFLLGMWLMNSGTAKGGSGEDDERDRLDDLTGRQDYAIELPDGTSITFDWLSPTSTPIAMGMEFERIRAEKGLSVNAAVEAAKSFTDTLINSSMLQGVNQMLDSTKYSEDNALVELALDSLLSYVTQGTTSTLLAQAERTGENERKTTFVDRNSGVSKGTQRALGQASAKTPGVDYNQIPYIDAWGRHEETGSPFVRALNNFVNPAYVSKKNETAADKEIRRLLDAGQTGVVPKRPAQSDKINNENLTAEEYVTYAETKGQLSFHMVSELIESDAYKGMSDADKAKAISEAYSCATALAKNTVKSDYEVPSQYKKAQTAQEAGVLADYYFYKLKQDEYEEKLGKGAAGEALRRELMGDKSLDKKQKGVIDELLITDNVIIQKDVKVDYSNAESFTITQMSEGAQKKWSRAQELGYTAQEYDKLYSIYAQQGKKKDEKLKELEAAGLSRREAKAFWKAMGEKD